MKWNKFRLKTTTAAEDIVSSILSDLGIEGVEIEDKVPLTQKEKEQMFVDILPETIPDDGIVSKKESEHYGRSQGVLVHRKRSRLYPYL